MINKYMELYLVDSGTLSSMIVVVESKLEGRRKRLQNNRRCDNPNKRKQQNDRVVYTIDDK